VFFYFHHFGLFFSRQDAKKTSIFIDFVSNPLFNFKPFKKNLIILLTQEDI